MMRQAVIVFAMFIGGCQLLLPEFKIVDGGTDSNSNLANGDACTNESQCQSGHCLNSVCCPPGGECCNENVGCGGLACDLVMFTCYTECAPGGPDNDEYCIPEYHCDDNSCLEDIVTGYCTENSDCVSDECVNNNCCEHAGLCCGGDMDCPEMFDGCATDNTQTCVFSVFTFPDTGQAGECYNSSGALVDCSTITPGTEYYGQDGHYPGPGRVYNFNSGWIVDQITGLAWTVGPHSQDGWDNAVVNCDSETAGSMTSWRLPKRHELLSIVDYRIGSGVEPDPDFNFDPLTEMMWSVESSGYNATMAWAVNFDTGDLVRVAKMDIEPRYICVTEM